MILTRILDLIFPRRCLNCGAKIAGTEAVCAACFAAIRLNTALFCGKCGARLADGKKICHADFLYVLGAATDYADGAVKGLIHALKFKRVSSAAGPLTRLLVRYAENLRLPLADCLVVPLPLSGRRLRERGFNQSELIAEIFAARFGLPIETKNFLRTKNAKAQSETKSLDERRENIKGCFAVRHPELFRGRKIILIDDVTTSGATLYEAALALKSAGARKIIALAVARA